MYIAPEEMVGDRRSGMQRTVKTQATEYVPQRRNENRIKRIGDGSTKEQNAGTEYLFRCDPWPAENV